MGIGKGSSRWKKHILSPGPKVGTNVEHVSAGRKERNPGCTKGHCRRPGGQDGGQLVVLVKGHRNLGLLSSGTKVIGVYLVRLFLMSL